MSTYNTSTSSSLTVLIQHHIAGFSIINSPVVLYLDHTLFLLDSPQGPLAGSIVH